MAKKQIKLNEEQFRNFVSYSVARLLKESRPINFDHNGVMDYDGEEDDGSLKLFGYIEFPVFDGEFDDIIAEAITQVTGEKFDEEWANKYMAGYSPETRAYFERTGEDPAPDQSDWLDDMYRKYFDGENPEIYIHLDEDGFLVNWLLVDNGYSPEVKQMYNLIIGKAIEKYDDGWKLLSMLNPNLYESRRINESWDEHAPWLKDGLDGNYEDENGIAPWTEGDGFEPENEYEGLTWDEYCEKKSAENKEDKERANDDYDFAPGFPIHVDKEELDEMIQRTIRRFKK